MPKKKKKMLFSWFWQLRRLVFNQSSPVHPVSESRGGPLSVTDGRTDGPTGILVSNIGLLVSLERVTGSKARRLDKVEGKVLTPGMLGTLWMAKVRAYGG